MPDFQVTLERTVTVNVFAANHAAAAVVAEDAKPDFQAFSVEATSEGEPNGDFMEVVARCTACHKPILAGMDGPFDTFVSDGDRGKFHIECARELIDDVGPAPQPPDGM